MWQLNLNLKSVSEDACLRSTGKLFPNGALLYEKLLYKDKYNQFEAVEELIVLIFLKR